MGDCQIRWKTKEADSVMAVLMDLDKLCPKTRQSSYEKQRVLSNTYVFKTMSIGRRRESSLTSKRLSQENGGILCKKEMGTVLDTPGNSGTNKMNPDDRNVLSEKDKQSTKRNVLICRGKAGHEFPCIDYMSVSLNSQLEMIDKRCHFPYSVSSFDPKPRKKVRDVLQDLKSDYRRYREQGRHSRPKNDERNDASSKHNCVACSRTMSRSWKPEDPFTRFKDVWIPGNVGNIFQETEKNGNNPEANMQRSGEEDDWRMGNGCMKIDASQRVSDSAISNLVTNCESDDSVASCSESDIAISSKESAQSLNDSEVGSEEESMNRCCEGESAALKFQDELKGNYQLSPNSVLDQSDVRIPSRIKHFDHEDLWKLLQSLNIELEETFSEESEIIVSDEEDDDHTSACLIADDINIKQWFGDHESKNYSYMVDVLDESRIFSSEPYMDFNAWYSLEYPIGPSLFEALEIKYGKQISFDKNHRHLLFDRINSGLASIFNLDIDFHVCTMSMKRKLFSFLRRDKVEDELWRILTCQEKAKTTQDLSEKAVDELFEFEEGISILCSELESILFDELVIEFLSM